MRKPPPSIKPTVVNPINRNTNHYFCNNGANLIAGPTNSLDDKIQALEIIDYALMLKDEDFFQLFSGSRMWRLIDDLGKWSWTSKNKSKIKNIFHVKTKDDKLKSIKFRNELNSYLDSWMEAIPLNAKGKDSVFVEAHKRYEKLKL
jgi:hypothetical protein